MNIYKLKFEQTVKYEHELVIETELSEEELNEILNEIDFENDGTLDDVACLLEKNKEITITEYNEKSDPYDWEIECIDIDKVEE